ncbi:ABC transporter ATP-binding protein [Advenella sp. WQ 585]|uniref:ABC transporter ATP-binding protein n=1 Tax=Advenella mandrilli TaxID=2800330 RepID=A0ABS1E8T6_9BURK|nr:ABC transporter ATP-binding protein [Advenella mandrilli]MBK1779784.1 ABC transporter ATP-binding protein [Advenella mandrilli]
MQENHVGQSNEQVLSVENLHIEFPIYKGAVKALNGVTLQVGAGEIVGLVGESGSGKSVCAMMSMRLIPADSYRVTHGTIYQSGKDVLKLSEKEMRAIRGREVSMIFQEPMTALNPVMKVGKQIVNVILQHQSMSKAKAKEKTLDLLRDMYIADPERVVDSYPFELSGGMRQRIMIALAFSCEPKLLIADEPTTALDVTVQKQVLLLLRERARKTGAAILLITHDMAVVSQFCERVYVMYAGAVVEDGQTRDVMRRPRHPYTQGLLAGLPENVVPGTPLKTIGGQVPDLAQLPTCCSFMNRCERKEYICRNAPDLLPLTSDPSHKVACWIVQEEDERHAR